MTSETIDSRPELRDAMRARRANLSDEERRRAAEQVKARILAWPAFRSARRLAAYVAMGGELDPAPIVVATQAREKQWCLPVLTENADVPLIFRPWDQDTPMTKNRFKIPEPVDEGHPDLSPESLDLALVPLTAADIQGNRLGQGGGFYDKTFAFRRHQHDGAPILAGMAYSFQVVARVAARPWDVPLDVIVTPSEIIDCRAARSS